MNLAHRGHPSLSAKLPALVRRLADAHMAAGGVLTGTQSRSDREAAVYPDQQSGVVDIGPSLAGVDLALHLTTTALLTPHSSLVLAFRGYQDLVTSRSCMVH